MDKKIIKFDDTEIEKYKFHQHGSPIYIDNVDINKIVVSNKLSFGENFFKNFIGYNDAKKNRSLCYAFQKYVDIEETLIKLNVCLF